MLKSISTLTINQTKNKNHEKIKEIVGMYRKNTVTIKGTVEERIEQVKNAVAQYV